MKGEKKIVAGFNETSCYIFKAYRYTSICFSFYKALIIIQLCH